MSVCTGSAWARFTSQCLSESLKNSLSSVAGNIENFLLFLSGAQISINHAVKLAKDDITDWADVRTVADCQYLAGNPDSTAKAS